MKGEKSPKKHRSWTKRELLFLVENYSRIGPGGCSQILGRPYRAVAQKACELGLTHRRNRPHRFWEEKEIQFLKQNYSKLGRVGCAKALGRSLWSVDGKARELGLTRKREQRPWEEEEIQFLKRNFARLGLDGCSEALGRTRESVKYKAHSLGLTVGEAPGSPKLSKNKKADLPDPPRIKGDPQELLPKEKPALRASSEDSRPENFERARNSGDECPEPQRKPWWRRLLPGLSRP